MTNTLLLIDGHSMAFRAFYALPVENFTTSSGQATNAVYGFISMFSRLLDHERPSHVAVAFDVSRHSFRTDIYPEYKGTREETPKEFTGQVDLIKELLQCMGIATLSKENYEADDILATLSTQGANQGMKVLVASGDRDTFQLITDQVTVIYPGKSTQDLRYMTPDAVEDKYGVTPGRYPEIAALVGESSDNLPGVPGVGPKTAAQWINKFDGLDNLLLSASEVGGKRGEALRDNIELVRRNRQLNRLLTDVELPVQPDQLAPKPANREKLEHLFSTLEFSSLRQRVYAALQNGEAEPTDSEPKEAIANTLEVQVLDPTQSLAQWLDENPADKYTLSYCGQGKPGEGRLDGFALATSQKMIVLDTVSLSATQQKEVTEFLLSSPALVLHSGKAAFHCFASQGWALGNICFDTELAAYLCQPQSRGYSLADLSQSYLGVELEEVDDSPALFKMDGINQEKSPWEEELLQQAQTIIQLEGILRRQLTEQGMLDLLVDMELPVQKILAQMESTGIAMDVDKLESLSKELRSAASSAQEDAFLAIGHETNLSSPKQLQTVLFDELDMPKTRKTKTGWTTDAEALQDLYAKTEHPFLQALLRYRDNTKLAQMVDGLISEVQPDRRIRTTFQQTVAATGRIASSEPNLQNIPARSDTGIRIREAFVPGDGYEALMSVDYSQIEMRIMAHLSQDTAVTEAFNLGEDLHKSMASMVFGIPMEEVTSQLRNRIKATSYGLAYGLSPYGLSKQLGVSVEEARDLHRRYFERFAGIGRYLQEVVEQARQAGYTETMFGRRRYFPQLTSENTRVREMAERAALNAPIQGSAADIIKVAMINVDEELRQGGYESRVCLQIHDELLLEIAPGEQQQVEELVRNAMASSVQMSVPLDVAVGIGKSWRDAAH